MSETHPEAAAPAAETPVAAATEAPATPAPADPAAEVPASPEASAPAPEPPPSLLGTEAPAGEHAPETLAAAEPEALAYEPFTLPEGMQAEPERIAAFTALVGEHKLPQEAAQKLIDLYVADRQTMLDALPQQWQNTFNETRQGWVQEVETRFGNRRDTVLNAARSAIRQAATNDAHRDRLWNMMAFTGAGDHPDMIEAWANISRLLSERKAPPSPDALLPRAANGRGRPEDARYPNMPARNP